MIATITLIAIIQSLATSLGVGGSTLAIINFFVAIADGTIDPTERHMMGVVYTVLRVAMVLVTASTLLLFVHAYITQGTAALMTFHFAQLIVLGVLIGNALLMTARLMSSKFGPAIQAGSWYTLGVLATLGALTLTNFTLLEFIVVYSVTLGFTIGIVNVLMTQLSATRKVSQ